MPIIDVAVWKEYEDKNKDPYGGCCVKVAREVMRLLDSRGEFSAFDIISEASKNVDSGGITGFMAGAVATMVAQCHSRGEEFNDKWNEAYGVSKEKALGSTVNPALITIDTKGP